MKKIKFTMNKLTLILDTMCLQHKIISSSALIFQNVSFPGKRSNYDFTEIRSHKICRTHPISNCRSKELLGENNNNIHFFD